MTATQISKSKVKGLHMHELNEVHFITELEQSYNSILLSSFGPYGSLTLLRNSASNDILTASSSQYLQHLPISHPCAKFINALIKAQLDIYGTHGSFIGILCSGLLYRSLRLQSNITHRIICDISEWICDKLSENFVKEVSDSAYKMDIGCLSDVLCIIRGVLSSKPWPMLFSNERQHIECKIAEAFLMTVPDKSDGELGKVIVYSDEEHSSLIDSRIINGLIYRETDYCITDHSSTLNAFNSKENLKVVVFTVPLDPTMEGPLIEWNSSTTYDSNLIESYSDILKCFLKKHDIDILANQKYIHPSIKYDLKNAGILVLERLGTAQANHFINMVKCCPITSLKQIHCKAIEEFFGYVPSVKIFNLGDKTYLHIEPLSHCQDVTFLLTGRDIHFTEFLKECIASCTDILQKLIINPRVVPGAGCLETVVCGYLINLRKSVMELLIDKYDTTEAKINEIFQCFITTFSHLALTSAGGTSSKISNYFLDESFHLWYFPTTFDASVFISRKCACRNLSYMEDLQIIPLSSLNKIVNFETFDKFKDVRIDLNSSLNIKSHSQSVIDHMASKLNALQLALNGFLELYRIGICIYDK